MRPAWPRWVDPRCGGRGNDWHPKLSILFPAAGCDRRLSGLVLSKARCNGSRARRPRARSSSACAREPRSQPATDHARPPSSPCSWNTQGNARCSEGAAPLRREFHQVPVRPHRVDVVHHRVSVLEMENLVVALRETCSTGSSHILGLSVTCSRPDGKASASTTDAEDIGPQR